MKEEASDQNGNEKHIYHRILPWCGGHKMKLTLIVVVTVLLGGVLYQVENKDTVKITEDLEPEKVEIRERVTLTIRIIPLEQVKGDFEIEIKPENTSYIYLHEENASYNPENQSWIIPLGKLDLRVGMKIMLLQGTWEYVMVLYGCRFLPKNAKGYRNCCIMDIKIFQVYEDILQLRIEFLILFFGMHHLPILVYIR